MYDVVSLINPPYSFIQHCPPKQIFKIWKFRVWRVSRYYRTVEIRNMSSTADRQDGSPPDSSGSSSGVGSSTPSGGSSSNTEVIDVDFATRSVLVIKAQPIFNLRGQEHELPPEVINTVDEFVAPKGYQRSGSRESLFMYSLGVYLKPIDVDNPVHKYYCLASPECRDKKHAILCKEGDRSNVNSQHKKKHNLCGMSGYAFSFFSRPKTDHCAAFGRSFRFSIRSPFLNDAEVQVHAGRVVRTPTLSSQAKRM